MPTYEFSCKNCAKKFTVFTPISQKSEVRCPSCSSAELKQLFSNPFSFLKSKDVCRIPPRGGFG